MADGFYYEFYIHAATALDSTIKTTLKGQVILCGKANTLKAVTPSPFSTTLSLTIPMSENTVYNLSQLFTLETASVNFDVSTCFYNYTICDLTGCGLETKYKDQFAIGNVSDYNTTLTIFSTGAHNKTDISLGVYQPDYSLLKFDFSLEACDETPIKAVKSKDKKDKTDKINDEDLYTIQLESLFTSTSPNLCKITGYKLLAMMNNQQPISEYVEQYVSLNDTYLNVKPNIPKEISFYLVAEGQPGQ